VPEFEGYYRVNSIFLRLCVVARLAKPRSNLVVKRVDPLLRLPAQEGISLVVNDIPDVGGVGLARFDCDDVPACP